MYTTEIIFPIDPLKISNVSVNKKDQRDVMGISCNNPARCGITKKPKPII